MHRPLAALAGIMLAASAASASASVGTVRVLVLPLTWGPPVPSAAQLQLALDESDAFLARSSFGQASIRGTVAPVVTGFVVPPACFADANEDAGLGAVSRAARAAATMLGYDLAAYDRFVYVFPERVCGLGGLGAGRDVLLAGSIDGLVHELGHTFRLPHAGGAACVTCGVREYGDPESVMGNGGADFNAWEKAQLGWLHSVRRASRSGIYPIEPVDRAAAGPQALLVRLPAGTLWVEHRVSPTPRVSIRIVKRPRSGGAVRSVYLAGGRSTATLRGVLRARLVSGGLALTRLDGR